MGCFGNQSNSDEPSDTTSASESESTARGPLGAAREGLSAIRGMADAAQAYVEQQESGVTYEVVDFRQLRDLLPESAAGLERTEIEGERQGMGGSITISKANAVYSNEDNSRINVTLFDGAGAMGMFAMVGAAWMMVDVDRESSDGFERTSTFEGGKSFEKYSERNARGELQFIVADRFLVSLEGSGITMDELYEAARDIDLRGLEALREEGRTEVEA